MRLSVAILIGALLVGPASALGSSRVPRADREAINATLDVFVPAALGRRHSERAWRLATAQMHVGGTRSGWARGELPIPPFPVAGTRFHGWTVDEFRPNGAELVLLVHPRRGANVGPISYNVAMRKVRGHWLVDSFVPAAVFAAPGSGSSIEAAPDFSPQAKVSNSARHGRLSSDWLFVILGAIGGLIVLVPTLVFGVHVIRDRRAARRYASPSRLV